MKENIVYTKRPTIDEWAFNLIKDYAERGTCVRRKVGALGLDRYNRIVGLGMNGVPRGWPHCSVQDGVCSGGWDKPGNTANCEAIHAEINMILNSSQPYEIDTVYVTCTPCFECCKVLANLPNLKVVRALETYADSRGLQFLAKSGILVLVGETSEEELLPPGSGGA